MPNKRPPAKRPRLDLARVKPLAQQNALSKKDLDNATGHYLATAASVAQAQAQVDQAELNLSYTTIRSPVNGISSSARQTDGTYINPQNSLLTTVAVLSPMWVNFSISENEMQEYRTSGGPRAPASAARPRIRGGNCPGGRIDSFPTRVA